MDLESYYGSSSVQQHQQQASFKNHMTSSQQYHESMTSSKKVTKKTTTTSSNYEDSSKTSRHMEAQDILDEDFLKEQEFIENYIESSLKESRERSIKHSQKTYTQDTSFEERKTNNKVSVKAIKGTVNKQTKKDDVIDGFQKVTVSSGPNEVNHFSRSISHDPENDVTSSSEDDFDDVSREMVNEDMIVPQTDPMNDLSGERSFEEIYGQDQNHKNVYKEQTVNIKLRKNEDQKQSNQQQFFDDQPIRMNIDVSRDRNQHQYHQVDGHDHQANQHQQFTKNEPIKMQIGVSHDQHNHHHQVDHHKHQQTNHHQHFTKNEPIKMQIGVSHDQHNHHHQVDHHKHQQTNHHQQYTKNEPIKMQIGVSHDHHHGHTHQDQSFEEITYRIPVEHNHGYDQQDGVSNRRVQVMVRSPRDGQPDFENHGTTTKDNRLSVNESQIPIDIQVQQTSTRPGAIRVMVSPNPHSQEKSSTGFRPIQKKDSPELHNHQHVITIKPTAVRKSSDSSTHSLENHQSHHHQTNRQTHNVYGQNTSSEQYHSLQHQHNRKRSDDSEQIEIIRSIRKSSLPEGFDSDSEFRRETDLQLQRQRDLQQRMSQRQHNEARSLQRNQQNSEYYKQQQYHQQKLMQHQQHLQRIQQQQQKRKQQSEEKRCEGDKHAHVVLNGRVMRRHSFDNSSLTERKQDDEEQKYIAEHQQRKVKTQRGERQQTRVRRLSYEQERDKLEEELRRLQKKEVRKQQQEEIRSSKSKQNYQQNENYQQQIDLQQQHQQRSQSSQHYENQEMFQQQQHEHQQSKNHQQYRQNQQLLQPHQQRSSKQRGQQQIQQTTTTTTTNIHDHQTRQNEIFNDHPQQYYSQSASNTPVIQRRKLLPDNQQYPASANTTPNVQRKRGKIPNVLKVAFQSEDIINTGTQRRKSNPNIILGRTDINKQRNEMDITHHSHTLPRNFGTKKKNQQIKTNTLTTTSTTTRSTRPSRSNKDVKSRSNSLGSSHSLSMSVLDESRMNKAQQKIIEQQNSNVQNYIGQQNNVNQQAIQHQYDHNQQVNSTKSRQQNVENNTNQQTIQHQYDYNQQVNSTKSRQHVKNNVNQQAIQHQYDHNQQVNSTKSRQQRVENRVGVSVNKQRHVQQQRGLTTHQILAETMKAQNKQQAVSTENDGLTIINGSHFKKEQPIRKTSTAFTKLTKPQPKRPTPNKPKRVEPAKPRQEDVYQSIKVSAKGGVITLFSDKDSKKVEVSDSMKQNITTSMYGYHQSHKSKHTFQDSNEQHSTCYIEDHDSTAYRDTVQWNAAPGYQNEQDTELVYYTVCTHFFHPENNDWIQKIHRMGQARVPKNRPHNEKCIFLNHLYDPDKEEIIVHKVINQNQQIMGLDQSDNVPQYQNKRRDPVLINNNFEQQRSNQHMHENQQSMQGVYGQHQQNMSMANHGSHDQQHLPIPSAGLRSRADSHNRSWVDQAFSDAYDTMSERMDTTGYSTTFDELDTAFDARSIDSSISSKSGYQNHTQQQRQHFQQSGNSVQQQNQYQQQQQQQQRNINKDYAKFIKQQMNTSSEGR
ncbi:uncharacterized protein DDB_G0290301-like [Clytia hemisphaerica]|uniref:Uncharacterized protein n=1 Tax=Clytia hemisphaerica TaxID=252671 RepID=A0A7M5XC76_9CNID